MKFALVGCGKMASVYSDILRYLNHEIIIGIGKKGSQTHKDFGKKYNCFTTDDITYISKIQNDLSGVIVTTPPDQSLDWVLNYPGQNFLIEKPAQLTSENLKKLCDFNGNIFVAYNRKFYQTFLDLKDFVSNQKKKCLINVNIPEKKLPIILLNKKSVNYNLIANSCHIISILRPVLGDLKLNSTFSGFNTFNYDIGEFHSISSFGHLLRISIHLDEFSNTSIYVKGDSNSFELKPIEKSFLINGMAVNFSENLNHRSYEPIRNLISNETLSNQFKPGILKQILAFLDFCKGSSVHSSLTGLKEAIRILEEIEALYL